MKNYSALEILCIDIANQYGEVPIDKVKYDMLTIQINKLNKQILEIQNAENMQQMSKDTPSELFCETKTW